MSTSDASKSQPSVTLKDIAERCGVDVSTVSRALRGSSLHNEKTVQHIQRVAAEMGYDPTRYQGARRLVLSRFGKEVANRLFAIFLPPYFYYSQYGVLLFQGVLDVLTPAGFGLLTMETSPDIMSGKVFPPSFSRGDVDGAIVIDDPEFFAPVLERLRNTPGFAARPVVNILRCDVPGCSSVTIDAVQGAYTTAQHLLSLGHRHILYFRRQGDKPYGGQQDYFVEGYQAAFRDHGLDPATHLHSFVLDVALYEKIFTVGSHRQLFLMQEKNWSPSHPLTREFKKHPEITAILAPNDMAAIVVRNIIRCGGFSVPHDISITGFDDVDPMLDDSGKNMLTTMSVPLRKIGRKAAKMLIAQVTDATLREEKIVVPISLIERGSTAPPSR